ncbi:hypothetical protein EVB55_095 [Rhizobium phage RHph_Y68]|uniref:Uncharacterized protein n=1 Tax=Rhizobium phage RHph_Y68 TaxID=2509787 RepID=A0A7S5QY92_9CAUD|nr:hypothetical protein PP934_gp095 [Rhizobium phage RHph_Y68]QIG68030.1 hypothetical protein EVB55_095 [Rhizobium phage RHph_Y68]
MFYIIQNRTEDRNRFDRNSDPVFQNPYVDQIGICNFTYGDTPKFLLCPINQLKKTSEVWYFSEKWKAEEFIKISNSEGLEIREGEFVWSRDVKKMRVL